MVTFIVRKVKIALNNNMEFSGIAKSLIIALKQPTLYFPLKKLKLIR